MSDNPTTAQNDTPDKAAANADSPPAAPRSGPNPWYIVALVLAAVVAAGAGFFGGQTTENNTAQETLSAITQAAAAQTETQTALEAAFTATPLPTGTATPTATPDVPQAVVLPYSVTVYDAPLANAQMLTTLTQDTPVEIVGLSEDNAWFEIAFTTDEGEAQTGFVHTDTLHITGGVLTGLAVAVVPSATPTVTPTPTPTLTPPPTETPTPSLTPTPDVPVAQVMAVTVPLREGPGPDFSVIDYLPQASLVEITGVSDGGEWLAIRYALDDDDTVQTGFVPANSLQLTGGSLADLAVIPRPTAIVPDQPQVRASGALLAVRRGPADAFELVGAVDSETSLTVTAISLDGSWLQVNFPASPTGLGWVSAQAVMLDGPPIDNLPVVEGPLLPTPTPIVVRVESQPGGVTRDAPSQPQTGVDAPGDVELASLPRGSQIALDSIPGVDDHVYEYAIRIDGTDVDGPYEVFISAVTATTDNGNQLKVIIDAAGDIEDFEDDLSDFFPITVGRVNGAAYAYLELNELCIPADDAPEITFLLEDFATILGLGGERMIDLVRDLGVFGIVPDNGLLDLGGTHYQFLGYPAQTDGDFIPTGDAKIDLWWTDNDRTLYAMDMTFQFSEDSGVPPQILRELDPNARVTDAFEGTARFHLLPLMLGEEAVAFAAPPAACDFLR